MASTTTVLGLPFPQDGDDNDVTQDLEDLAQRLDDVPGVEALTNAEIAALTSGQKSTGRVVYNTTTSKLQQWSGSAWVEVDAAALAAAAAAQSTANAALPKAGGTMSGAIAMGGSKVTGLGAASANGDAVRYEQLSKVYAIGVRTLSQTVAGFAQDVITYSTDDDPAGLMNIGTGVFVAPSAGLYVATGWVEKSLNFSSCKVALYQGATIVAGQEAGTNGSGYGYSLSAVVLCAASDQLTMQFYNGNASSIGIAGRFAVARLAGW